MSTVDVAASEFNSEAVELIAADKITAINKPMIPDGRFVSINEINTKSLSFDSISEKLFLIRVLAFLRCNNSFSRK